MKLTLIGGGGVRAPLFVASCLARAHHIGLTEIALLDTRQDHLDAVTPLVEEIVRTSGAKVAIVATTNPATAIRNASYIVTTIRVGGDDSRIRDERIALEQGVLGQETTGPGGFAMATRTIPAAQKYAEMVADLAPQAWTFNFSNPAGLVTQALRDAGHDRVIGICDSANGGQNHVAEFLGLDPYTLQAEVYGLNHLSWCRSVRRNGEDLLSPLLKDSTFRATTSLGLFDADLVVSKGLWLNEYLYYYYYADAAIKEIVTASSTRGEEVRELNLALFARLSSKGSVSAALEHYYNYQRRRISTYMPFNRPSSEVEATDSRRKSARARSRMEEGYAGVALTVIEALNSSEPTTTALNVPNAGAIDGFLDDDVVEVSCSISAGQINPIRIGAVSGGDFALMSAVKSYERLTVEAIQARSRNLAVDALMAHPLVLTYPKAKALVNNYLAANAEFVGKWRD